MLFAMVHGIVVPFVGKHSLEPLYLFSDL